MRTDPTNSNGSVLIIALLTITILTLICATSLYITSQNTSTGVQTGAWQQALTGAEAGIDAAVRALNQNGKGGANAWINWKTVSTATLPTKEPAGGTGSTATAPPTTSQYNYLPSSSLSIGYPNTEGTTSVTTWVTIDTAGGLSDSTGSWYRVRATGQAVFQSNSVYKRVSNNRLDNDLRNTITMNFNRKGGSNLGPTRTIEVILQPVPQGGARGITLATWLVMSGTSYADSFNSGNGVWSLANRDLSYPQLVATNNTSNQGKFTQNNTNYVYGGMVYSGTAPQNTNSTTVTGQRSTPDNVSIPSVSDPTAQGTTQYNWAYTNPFTGVVTNYGWNSQGGGSGGGTYPPSAGNYGTITGGGGLPTYGGSPVTSITANGSASSPELIIINGDFNVSGGNSFTINANTKTQNGVTTTDPTNSYVTIWVKGGQWNVNGGGYVTQASGTHVTWIIDKDITISGSSYYNNQNNSASYVTFVGTGSNNNFTNSGQSAFVGVLDAPNYNATISGSGDTTGAIVANNLTMSGSGNFHFDESLSPNNAAIGNYAFASWFEDNSDPTHKDVNGNYVVY